MSRCEAGFSGEGGWLKGCWDGCRVFVFSRWMFDDGMLVLLSGVFLGGCFLFQTFPCLFFIFP